MVHMQPPEGCECQSSSLCTERGSDGSYSTTWASGARFSMSLQLTVRRRRGSTPPLLVRSTPLACPTCPACPAGCPAGCWCACAAAWPPGAVAAALWRSSAATTEGEAKVSGPSEVLLLALLGGRGSGCCAPPPLAKAAPAAAACGWPAPAAAGPVPGASLMAGFGRGGLLRGSTLPPGGEAPRGGEAPNGAPNGEVPSGGELPRGGEPPWGEAAPLSASCGMLLPACGAAL